MGSSGCSGPGTSCGAGIQCIVYGTGTTALGASAATTTAYDEAGVTRISYYDGLGRLTQVTENGSEATAYTYDALDDLTGVTQPGGQTRSFVYSSLRRLTSATNPENGSISYAYDGNGNLLTRTQGALIATYTYNNLNEVLTKSYNDGTTPSVTYTYQVDWLKSATVGTGGTVNTNVTFDGLGRVTYSTQTTNSHTYPFNYNSYNLADSVTSMTTPSGRVVTTGYNNANQPTAVTGVLGTTTHYATSITYAPHGALNGMDLGNSLWPTTTFNYRLQTTGMILGTYQYGADIWSLTNSYSASSNNGNITGQTLVVPGMTSIGDVYTYDGVNRLSIAAENSSNPLSPPCPDAGSLWCRQYNHYAGGNGNRRTLAASGQGLSPVEPVSFDAYNHITGTGWTYDTAGRGDLTQDPTGETFAYDAESRQKSYCGLGGCTTYAYDGAGHRVSAQNPDGSTVAYVYDVAGNLAAEYASEPAPTVCTNSPCYVTTDQLGSTRVMTDATGCAVYRQDYLPFGETILTSGGSPRMSATGGSICATNGYPASSGSVRQQFTGKERDTESGLDFFGARYFSGAQGRFTSPDPGGASASLFDPQRWNAYSYSVNNPLKFVDRDGEVPILAVTAVIGAGVGAPEGRFLT